MDLVGISLSTNVISAIIGKQLFCQAINDASNSIYGSLSSIIYYNDDIHDILLKLDIKNKIKNIELLIQKINKSNELINKCIENLHDIILLIREDIKQINIKIKNHKNLYFSNWRYINFTKELKNITIHSNILDIRLDFLIKTINIFNIAG